ncbi:rhodanese-like domain-containing protein [Solwaraspora sp. WMMD1047]|uniref:rhodanese-like domain-containing protein n=1 Tax=Solwaraspora sp. WMMD1047 TaxID=3016102 RepID=UPI002415AA73|nr:rhodanese-like domain-containing protein [Solwaraspora sp. WMMD1047]MDG4833071.1 rhodanese-like domain-containing protein [Solwaraspora sp. WMMD1047]
MTTPPCHPALAPPPAAPDHAAAWFAAKLAAQTDVSDVRAALASGDPGFQLVDSRTLPGWRQGHIPGAIHLPTSVIPVRAAQLLDPAVPVVTYCWGPGCDGATRAAHALASRGFRVKEMIGGIEYWIREGFPVVTGDGRHSRPADPLTAPVGPAEPSITPDRP